MQRRPAGADFRAVQRGFTLVEVLVALGIAAILMSALATIFASTVTTRQQVLRDGQKIESARFSLDTLSEDIRLAGYWGNYTPAGRWSSVSWQPLTAYETSGVGTGACTATALTTGWANVGTGTVKIPVPILGFEAHEEDATQPIDADVADGTPSSCLPKYLPGTDVLVIRRARTGGICALPSPSVPANSICALASEVNTLLTSAAYSTKTFLQVSACSSEVGTTDFKVGLGSLGTATFNLKRLGCAASPVAPIWELITRVYYVASENEAGDSIPTLKMIDLSAGGTTPVTIAPGVVDFHLEYGIDTTADGSADAYVKSKTSLPISPNSPQRFKLDGTTVTGSALAAPWGGATNWQDVVAVKLWVVVRDLESTAGYTNSKEYVLGSISIPAATINARAPGGSAAYRYKLSGSTVKVVNTSGRREDSIP